MIITFDANVGKPLEVYMRYPTVSVERSRDKVAEFKAYPEECTCGLKWNVKEQAKLIEGE
jgi:hypothetical protein